MLYLDNAATTKINSEVLNEMLKELEHYGNSEAKFYEQAENAKKSIKLARRKVAHIINAKSDDEIVFTSGATEANNLVLKGTVLSSPLEHKKIIISAIEHSSIYDTCNYLKSCGITISIIPVNAQGQIDIGALEKEIDNNTVLVSIIAVNNEIGTIQDLHAIDRICAQKKVILHTDATQAIGKIKINVQEYEALHYVTFTAHKIYGPKGVGCLYVKNDDNGIKQNLTPLLHGGEQECNLRAGTLPNMLIVGFGKACEIAERDFEENHRKSMELEKILINKFKKAFNNKICINNEFSNRVPGILNIRFVGFNNLVLLKTMSPIIAASTGSACAVSKPSRILKAIGLSDDIISESIRISCSPYMNLDDLNEIDKL